MFSLYAELSRMLSLVKLSTVLSLVELSCWGFLQRFPLLNFLQCSPLLNFLQYCPLLSFLQCSPLASFLQCSPLLSFLQYSPLLSKNICRPFNFIVLPNNQYNYKESLLSKKYVKMKIKLKTLDVDKIYYMSLKNWMLYTKRKISKILEKIPLQT